MTRKIDKEEKFPDLLKKFMRRVRVGDTDLGKEIGVNRNTVRGWKNGDFLPTCDNAKRTAVFLRLTDKETQEFLKAAHSDCLPNSAFDAIDKWAATIFPKFIDDLLDQFSNIILLLTQAGWDEPPCRKALLIQAKERFTPDKVLHIFPPFCKKDSDSFLITLAQQCGLNNITSDADFEKRLEEQLNRVDKLFLLISRFEQISEQEKFAGIIRSLTERYKNLQVILCGNQKLESLKFAIGTLSLLNSATVKKWPELSKTEVLALRDHRFPDMQLTDNEVAQILKLSGSHPKLLNDCLNLKQENKNLSFDGYNECLKINGDIWQSFTPYRSDNNNGDKNKEEQILNWLERDHLGRKQPFILNPLLRELYWKNLLVNREGQLCWRCEAIRLTGKEVLS